MEKLVLASNNAGKLREFSELLSPLRYEIISQGELGIPPAEEPYLTFVENALSKAKHACALSGLPALADDSGICVHALNGEPGVHSARYASLNVDAEGQDNANNQKLITALASKLDRSAHYVCALVFLRHTLDPEPIIVQTRWYGSIIDHPKGSGGFGYDPYFFLAELGKTASELTALEKNMVSHRGQALRELVNQLDKYR